MLELPFEPIFWSVTNLTRYLRDLLESDELLQDVWVQGEISNFARPASGHLYFTLKDAGAALKCVMWRQTAANLNFAPRDGMAVEVHGRISLYEPQGQYQLYADALRPAGEGALYLEFLRLKARLQAEGLFEAHRKRALPEWPHTIGIVTSPTGAALQDMLNTLRRRFPLARVVLAPASVQGTEAPGELIAALQALNQQVAPDVILLARGGGSIEDLWAFNDENLARAIAASAAPVITGVGHETDFTIADFVADLRAPTPTAAAELATPNRPDLLNDLNQTALRLTQWLRSRLSAERQQLGLLKNRLSLRSPAALVRSQRQSLDEAERRLATALDYRLRERQLQLTSLSRRLESLNPLAILQRGYAALTTAEGRAVRSIAQLQPGDELHARLADGRLSARIHELSPLPPGEDD